MVKPLICRGYRSGAEGIRTRDLRRAKAHRHILARASVSGDFYILQVFCRSTGGALVRCVLACTGPVAVRSRGG
jgi:hypothetical protein